MGRLAESMVRHRRSAAELSVWSWVRSQLSLGTCRVPGSMRRAIGGRIKSAVLFMLENGDSFLAMGVALGVIILIVVGHPSTELIDAAVLGLLGTVALAILRNREREDLSALHQLAGDAISDRPFQVVWQKNHWNLVSRDMVESKETELVRFTRNDVATIAHWSRG